MAQSPKILGATRLKLFDSVLMWGPCWRMLRHRTRFREFRDAPRQAIAFLFACSLFLGLFTKWSPPPWVLPPQPFVAGCGGGIGSPAGAVLGGISGSMGALQGAGIGALQGGVLGDGGSGGGAVQPAPVTPSTCPPPPRPSGATGPVKDALLALGGGYRWMETQLNRAFPGFDIRMSPPDLLPYGMLLFLLAIGSGIDLLMRGARRVAPSLFERLNEEVAADTLTPTFGALAFALGFFLIGLFIAYAGALHLTGGSGWVRALGFLPFTVGFVLCFLIFGRWLPRWLADIHGTTTRNFWLINIAIELPIVVLLLALAH